MEKFRDVRALMTASVKDRIECKMSSGKLLQETQESAEGMAVGKKLAVQAHKSDWMPRIHRLAENRDKGVHL